MVVISGASGFIGRPLALRARSFFETSDVDCLAWDTDHDYERKGQDWLRAAGIPFVRTDLVSGRGLEKLTKAPKIVFHLAASTYTSMSDHRCNDIGTQNFIKALEPLNSSSHVLFTSTIAVTDNRPDYRQPLTEETPVFSLPSTAYGLSKLRAEEWLKERARMQGFSLTILRLSTVYGSGPRPTSLFDEMKKHVLCGSLVGRVNWPGLTGFVHVGDVVEVLLRFSQKPPKFGETATYILHTESRTLAKVSELLHRELRLPYRPVKLPRILWKTASMVGRRKRALSKILPSQIYSVVWRGSLIVDHVFWCDTDKVSRTLPDWRPRSLEATIAETLEPLK
jgi:nucleoside-diphosphate-sugar epimerase